MALTIVRDEVGQILVFDDRGNRIMIREDQDGVEVENCSDSPCEYVDEGDRHKFLFKGPRGPLGWERWKLLIGF